MTTVYNKRSNSDLFQESSLKKRKPDKEEVAACKIQRWFRKTMEQTFSPTYLQASYQKKHNGNLSKMVPLTVIALDISNPIYYDYLNSYIKVWDEFVDKKLERENEFPVGYINDLLEYSGILMLVKMKMVEAKETGFPRDHLFFIIKDPKEVQAISVLSKTEVNSAWKINELISSPVNKHRKFRGKDHVEGAGAALIAHAVLKSHNEKRKGWRQEDRTTVILKSGKDSYYQHLGFEKFDSKNKTHLSKANQSYSHFLRGASLRHFLKNYGGRFK